MAKNKPKAFVSYSWTSPAHRELVKEWSDRLISDGVDIVLDIYDLREGDDKYAFMERMVTDRSVTHVLVISDRQYAEKADSRKKGVGTESQIISQNVYEKVGQSKFIPIVVQFDDNHEPFLPTFLKSRMWIDFSTMESVNANWERLIRLLFGKPLHQKPPMGSPPSYVTQQAIHTFGQTHAKLNNLKQALLQGKPGIALHRNDFLDACLVVVDDLRIREAPSDATLVEKVMAQITALKPVRNDIVDWIILEVTTARDSDFSKLLIEFLEKLRELKTRPADVMSWRQQWYDAQTVFLYETFLYIVAALLRHESFSTLKDIFSAHYLIPRSERRGDVQFERFGCFWGHSDLLQEVLAPEGKRLLFPAAEIIKRHADRSDIPFDSVIEAELITLMMAYITPDVYWYPGTLHYANYTDSYGLFLKATRRRDFSKLAQITGISDAKELKEAVMKGEQGMNQYQWHFFRITGALSRMMNLDNLDTLK